MWLAGYTFTSARATRALANASERGADVRVLVEGGPVGGMSRTQARRLETLVAAGVAVRAVTGPHARYAYHHAKYAVADDRAVVLTENWKPSGTGGADSRGWGAVVSEPSVVAGLARTFEGDFAWRAAVPWDEYRAGRTFAADNATAGTYPTAFAPERVAFESARLLVAPDNAESAVLARLRAANETLRVVQMSVGGPDQAFVRETVAAARRGVEVRLLLSGAWYVREDNGAVVERLNRVAEREGLDLEARLAVPSGYGKIHAKGVVADDTVLLGSLNWNDNSARANREVVLALTGDAADYYRRVFDADWRASGPGTTLPGGVVAVLAVAALACLLAARRVEFE
ncbi:phospholipase D-like domain-containing protein [Halosegnis marinus]|uniref:phospholipase D-like domain-containing protein n=1 Tax=Halosegnis marinus TaxID=3034023 RepID=UPI003612AB73